MTALEKSVDFELRLNLDNAAFDPAPGPEVARILRELARKIENNERWPEDDEGGTFETTLRDLNGNSVGFAAITET